MLFNLTDRDKLIFQILSFILVDFTICINNCYIEAKFVFDYADSNLLISELSKERLKKGKAFNAYLKLSFALITCFSVVAILLVKSNYRIGGIKTLILVLQSIYLMPFLIFTTYYLKLITAFGENNFLADMSLIEYKKIDKIYNTRTYELYSVKLEEFTIEHNKKIVGKDRLPSDDYKYLLRKINL